MFGPEMLARDVHEARAIAQMKHSKEFSGWAMDNIQSDKERVVAELAADQAEAVRRFLSGELLPGHMMIDGVQSNIGGQAMQVIEDAPLEVRAMNFDGVNASNLGGSNKSH